MTQQTLLSADHQTTKTQPPDLFAVAAQKLHDMPVDWLPVKYETKESPYGKFYQITGAVPLRYLSKGKNKGKPVWPPDKDCQVFTFTPEQIDRVTLDWEAETNCCSLCGGDGQEFADGTRYRICRRCNGSGKPAQQNCAT